MDKKLKITTIDYLYQEFKNMYNTDKYELEAKLQEIDYQKKILYNYVKIKCSKVVLFQGYTLASFENKSISAYITKHGDFYEDGLEGKVFIIKLKQLRKLKVERKKVIEAIEEHKTLFATKEEFKFITGETNRMMVKRMIELGESYSINSELGFFAVSKKANKPGTRVLNHGETIKMKAALLAEGKVLKTPETPQGVSWKVYYTDKFFYRMKWFRISKFLYEEGVDRYRFYTAKGDNNVMTQLYTYIRSPNSSTLIYTK